MLRKFGRHGIHKGTITSFDDDGKLTFRVEYEDGDAEDLAEDDVRETLIDKRIIRVASRSRRDKEAEDSESDYFPEDASSDKHVNEVISSQATTQPLEVTIADETSQPLTIIASAVPITVSRKRSTPAQRQQSSSAMVRLFSTLQMGTLSLLTGSYPVLYQQYLLCCLLRYSYTIPLRKLVVMDRGKNVAYCP